MYTLTLGIQIVIRKIYIIFVLKVLTINLPSKKIHHDLS